MSCRRSSSHYLAQLDDRQRVERRLVVAGDGVKIVRAQHIVGRGVGIGQLHHGQLARIGAGLRQQRQAHCHELVGGEGWRNVGPEQGVETGLRQIGRQLQGEVRWLAAHPALGGQVAGHRAYGVCRVGDQIDAAAVVEVHRIFQDALGHELRHADGSRIRAAHLQRVACILCAPLEKIAELHAEVSAAVAWRLRGVAQRQGGERIDHAEVAHIAAVDRLHPEDARDDVRRHAVALLRSLEPHAEFLHEVTARADAQTVEKPAAVHPPVFLARRPRQNESGHRGAVLRPADQPRHQGFGQLVALHNARNQGLCGADIPVAQLGRRQRCGWSHAARAGKRRGRTSALSQGGRGQQRAQSQSGTGVQATAAAHIAGREGDLREFEHRSGQRAEQCRHVRTMELCAGRKRAGRGRRFNILSHLDCNFSFSAVTLLLSALP